METRIYFKNGSQLVIENVIYSILTEDLYNGGFLNLHVEFIDENKEKNAKVFNIKDISFFSNWN